MDYTELGKILSEYVRRFDEFNNPSTHDEGYKWRAISHFQQNWDKDASRDSFLQMFKAAMVKQVNLFNGQYKRPLGGIRRLLKDRGDYDFIYKPMSAHKMADIIDFEGDLGWGAYFSLSEYYKMCEEISAAFDGFPEVLERSEARRLQYAPGLDSTASRHITVYDIIYCAYQYDLNGVQSRPSVPRKERLAAAENQRLRAEKEAEISALREQLQEAEATTDALPDLTGQVVHHKVFGRGIVQSCTNEKLIVSFPQRDEPVAFVYSSGKINCIAGGFIIPEDESITAKIQSIFDGMASIQRLTTQITTATKELNKLLGK